MNQITFTLNGEQRTVYSLSVSQRTSLSDYIRNVANLRGTKTMCHEGGCGACVVSAAVPHPVDKEKHVIAVNSCLVSVLSCNNWDITTVEGVGNRKDGYNKIQKRLAQFNGTQCGYCTPGWILNMYSLTKVKPDITMKEVENSFGSNICRCTGYRPILDAFKSLASDATLELKSQIPDVEDLADRLCPKVKRLSKAQSEIGDDWCLINEDNAENVTIEFTGGVNKWLKVYKLGDIFKIFNVEGTDSYRLVAGNTGQGVYHIEEFPKLSIDISSVQELKETVLELNLNLAANITLSEAITLFDKYSKTEESFWYLSTLKTHLEWVAHVPVRNLGTIAGNLMLKHQHNEFESDIFVLMETIGAMLSIVGKDNVTADCSLQDFLNMDMKGKIILCVKMPPLSKEILLRTYKIAPRAQNAHAIINAGFLFDLKNGVIDRVSIVYGGVNAKFIHAAKTEDYLLGKPLFKDSTLTEAIQILSDEIVPDDNVASFDATFKKMLAVGQFYKAILSLSPPDKVDTRLISGGKIFDRPLSKGSQNYDTDQTLWPLNQPIPKLEALIQCSGEAKFTNDIPTLPSEVYATFVLSNIARGEVDYIDPSEAMKMLGVVAFYTHTDIPGTNSFTPKQFIDSDEEELLCSGKIKYYGQPIGIIVATTEKLANYAAKLVRVTYKNKVKRKPVLTVKDALIAPKNENRISQDVDIQPKNARGKDVDKVISGNYDVKGQYHFTMETQTCVVVPDENCLNVYASTQFVDFLLIAISKCLNIAENRINMTVRRLGGGYGAKASRSAMTATACALVAKLQNRPTRFVLSLETNMTAIGKRLPCYCEYEVGVSKAGVIQYANLKYWEDNGCSNNDKISGYTPVIMQYLYDTSTWHIEGYSVLTDTASNTWCRAPGTCEGQAIVEHIMERIADALNLDPIEVRIQNLAPASKSIEAMITEFKKDVNYEDRLKIVNKFNEENKWKKRGLALSIMSFPVEVGKLFYVAITIYHGDGTVAVSHGGIEMGQGINTKLAQVIAYELGIPLDKVVVKHTDNFTAPNCLSTSGSIGSESVCFAGIKACEILLERLKEYKSKDDKWEDVVNKAYDNNVDLHASYMLNGNEGLKDYPVQGITVAEVELDVLTGTYDILRVDLIEDIGQSMSPEIDVGQIEGALIMGLGYWTSEELKYDPNTGEPLTTRTWNYKPPGAKDIPIDMRISFKRNADNPVGVLRSKATGEPALVMAVVVTFALRKAVESARLDQGSSKYWVQIENPCTPENVLLATNPKIEQYKLRE